MPPPPRDTRSVDQLVLGALPQIWARFFKSFCIPPGYEPGEDLLDDIFCIVETCLSRDEADKAGAFTAIEFLESGSLSARAIVIGGERVGLVDPRAGQTQPEAHRLQSVSQKVTSNSMCTALLDYEAGPAKTGW
ncbi:hypothetical protein NTCA1_37800 [Novosphingobium sp. TCA1]|nr:hypothetical protein NTCA1_37800 [Novosphingobium sp. TCA1]